MTICLPVLADHTLPTAYQPRGSRELSLRPVRLSLRPVACRPMPLVSVYHSTEGLQ